MWRFLILACLLGLISLMAKPGMASSIESRNLKAEMERALELSHVGSASENLKTLTQLGKDYESYVDGNDRDLSLEKSFEKEYTKLLRALIDKNNQLTGLFEDTVLELGKSQYWNDETHSEKWSELNPYRWFGGQWNYFESSLNAKGLQLMSAVSTLSIQINLSFFEIREALPNIDLNVVNSLNDFFRSMVDKAIKSEFRGFSEESLRYLEQRGSFLNFYEQIQNSRRDSCITILEKV